ncbi:MAG: DUF2927 domain-containing protein [Paracoccus sp. (in: a-proteobacteria)]|nr:DUF2927 domain-containing protein [Paracoccus sp. (in: a-proteobacteria)]
MRWLLHGRAAAGLCEMRFGGAVGAVLVAMTVAACQPVAPASDPVVDPPAPPAERLPQPDRQAELRAARAERNRAANEAAIRASAQASSASQTQRDFYARAEQRLLAEGRLRRDRAPADIRIDPETLAGNFVQIALRDEYTRRDGALVPETRLAPLRRWQAPVRLQPEFGASTDLAQQRAWRAEIAQFADRLTAASGHPVRLAADQGNFIILVVTEDERREIGPRLDQLVPGIPPEDVAILRALPPAISCTVFAYSEAGSPVYSRAVAVIRAELPRLLRSSCIEEELAQGMGLANDSPTARPSVFNDDEEFARVTRHDELLLRILYDSRLRPGMTEVEALPIVRQIAKELIGEAT